MKKIRRKLILAAAFLVMTLAFTAPARAHAVNIIPMQMEMYSTSATPIYAAPDVFSPIVTYLDRFLNVRVTGITENGFFVVDLNGTYYIPGVYLVPKVEKEKSANQKAHENLDDITELYRRQLEMMEGYCKNFALKDVTGDGVPELIDEAGKEIYSYYDDGENRRLVILFYSENPVTFYYSKNNNRLLGKYRWNDKDYWEVYNRDTTFVPWGQFRCVSTDASAYTGNATTIERDRKNDQETRNDLYNILHEMLGLGSAENHPDDLNENK